MGMQEGGWKRFSVEESFSTLQRVASPDVAVALQQRSGVAPAFGRRRHTSGASSAARGSITRAARASLRKELSGRCQRGMDSVAVWADEVARTRPQDVFTMKTSSAATAALN